MSVRIWRSRWRKDRRRLRSVVSWGSQSNGYVESLIGKLRDELLNGEIFYTLREAQVLIERWRREYNQIRPHSSLGYRPPAPEAIEWPLGATRPATPAMSDSLT